ncbi:MAG: TIGR04063 family PEP-CTERM/XrtA system glycosyltransferase [Alphaproteobacteria bacterium]
MRILHVFDHSIPLQSGYTFRSLSLLTEQRRLGWETHHLTTPRHTEPYTPEETVDGWTFHRTPPAGGPALPVLRERAEMAATEARLNEIIPDIRPDILHAHSPVLNAIPAIRAGRRHGIPVNYEVRAFWEDAAASHGSTTEGSLRYRLTRALETYALKRAASVTTICEGLRGDIVARGVPEDRVTVIANAVDPSEFPADTPRDDALGAELGLDGRKVLGFLGSFYGYEGLHLLIEAMPGLLAQDPDIRLLLVGGGPEDQALRAQAAALPNPEAVIFTGRVHHAEVQRYYSLVDLLVYPRVSMRLTDIVTPLKPLEAMAQNKIMVASDVGGHKELIRDGETGNLFRADDVADLTATILRVLGASDSWNAQRRAGRAFVETERTWANSAANYRRAYGTALGRTVE